MEHKERVLAFHLATEIPPEEMEHISGGNNVHATITRTRTTVGDDHDTQGDNT